MPRSSVALYFLGFAAHSSRDSAEAPVRRIVADLPDVTKLGRTIPTMLDFALKAVREQLSDDAGIDAARLTFYASNFTPIGKTTPVSVLDDGDKIIVAFLGERERERDPRTRTSTRDDYDDRDRDRARKSKYEEDFEDYDPKAKKSSSKKKDPYDSDEYDPKAKKPSSSASKKKDPYDSEEYDPRAKKPSSSSKKQPEYSDSDDYDSRKKKERPSSAKGRERTLEKEKSKSMRELDRRDSNAGGWDKLRDKVLTVDTSKSKGKLVKEEYEPISKSSSSRGKEKDREFSSRDRDRDRDRDDRNRSESRDRRRGSDDEDEYESKDKRRSEKEKEFPWETSSPTPLGSDQIFGHQQQELLVKQKDCEHILMSSNELQSNPPKKSPSLQDSISTLCSDSAIPPPYLEKSSRVKKPKQTVRPTPNNNLNTSSGSDPSPANNFPSDSESPSIQNLESQSSALSLRANLEVGDPLSVIDAMALESQPKELNTKIFKPLFESSKRLVGQMQALMGYSLHIEPADAQNFTRLSQKINFAFENQRAINTINARLFAISYVTNIFNFAKTRNLQKSLSKGKAQIVELQTTVSSLEDAISHLNLENQVQKEQSLHLKSNLENVKKVLVKTMEEYQAELDRQAEAIKSQQPVIDAIQKAKLRQDLFIDTTIFIVSVYAANSFLIEYPLHVAGQVFMKTAPKPRRKFSKQMAKLLIVWFLMRRCKDVVCGYGMHNKLSPLSHPSLFKGA
ncbi:hypothetical protein BDR26DRAFT_923379 [Obelidium mucronatum]|nr:hypothetical protein BDR26DRAFT_923379 [Obelidium mucronatum]